MIEILKIGENFMINGEPTEGAEAANIIKKMNDYHNELDDLDGTIDIIMRSLRTTHNLSDDEYRENREALKYILKD